MPFDWPTWVCFVACLGIVCSLGLAYASLDPLADISTSDVALFVASTPFQQSNRTVPKLRSHGVRIGAATFLISAFVLICGYSGGLISVLTVNIYPSPPNTFDELYSKVTEVRNVSLLRLNSMFTIITSRKQTLVTTLFIF